MASLLDVYNNGATSSIISNPVSGAISSINSMASGIGSLNPALGSIATSLPSITALTSSVSNYMNAELENLKTKLPILSAVHKLNKSAAPLAGIQAGTEVDSITSGATQGITTLGPMMSSVQNSLSSSFTEISSALTGVAGSTPQEKLANFSASVPPATIKAGDGVTDITNPAYTSFMSTNASKINGLNNASSSITSTIGSATSSLASIQSTEQASLQQGIGKLKDMAFAKFASSTQPPAIQSIMDKFITPPTSATAVDSRIMNAAASKNRSVTEAVAPITNKPLARLPTVEAGVVPPTAPTTSRQGMSVEELASNRATLIEADEQLKSWKVRIAEKLQVINTYKSSVNYEEIKASYLNDTGNESKKSAYFTLRDELKNSQSYQDYLVDTTAYNDACKRHLSDMNTLLKALEVGSPSLTSGTASFGPLTLSVLT